MSSTYGYAISMTSMGDAAVYMSQFQSSVTELWNNNDTYTKS